MRTLKKTLALVLCLAMIAGLCCFGTSAAFADAAEIEYTEAAAVMNAIGVLKGDGTNFNPKGILTRAEAAVIIAKLIGEDNVKATSTFKDMKGYEWAQQFAAVCEAKGYILGDGAGNFFPGQTLTGYQFGLMLARVLGYKPAEEGVEAATYEIGTAALMKKIGLIYAIPGFDGTKGITREEAAALALKALTTTMVQYDNGGTTITGGGFTITTGASACEKQTWGTTGAGTYDYTGTTAANATDTIELCEKYFSKLKQSTTHEDAFGRPANIWSYDGKPVGTFVTADPVLTYTAPVTGGKLYTDLGKPFAGSFTFNRVVNGKDGSAITSAIVSGNTNSYGGNGTTIEIYKDLAGNYTAVAYQTMIAKISTHVPAVLDANGDISVKEYVTLAAFGGGSLPDLTENKFETTAFTEADEKLGTVVAITGTTTDGTNYTIQSVVPATKVENVAVTGFKTSTNVYDAPYAFVTAGGTTYKYNETADSTAEYTMAAPATYTLFLDANGYVLGSQTYTAAASTDYCYVLNRDAEGTAVAFTGKYAVKYQLLDMNGVVSVVTDLDTDSTPDVSVGAIVTVADDVLNAGYKTLTVKDAVASTKGFQTASITALNKTSPVIGGNIIANAETVFVLQTAADKWTVATGIANLPAYSSITTTTAAAYVSPVDGYADVVFVPNTYSGTAGSATAADVFYLLEASSTDRGYDAVNKVEFYNFKAIKNGELTTIKAAASTIAKTEGGGDVAVGLISGSVYNAYGYLATATQAADTTGVVLDATKTLSNAAVTFSAPVLKAYDATMLVADDAVVYIYNTVTKTLKVGTAADLVTADADGDLCLLRKSVTDNTVATIYFVGTLAP